MGDHSRMNLLHNLLVEDLVEFLVAACDNKHGHDEQMELLHTMSLFVDRFLSTRLSERSKCFPKVPPA